MANTLIFDFRHYYSRGERREADRIAYQWDLGHVMEIYVPLDATYHISYCFNDFPKTDNYAAESITAVDDGGYKLIAHVPNRYFERCGELRVYIVGEVDDHILTTYEGFITIRNRLQPEDYVDPDPENGARTDEGQAHVYAQQSEAWAVGTIDGAPVESTDPQYNNYSKYYAQQAAGSASDAAGSATAAAGSAATAAAIRDAVEAILGVYATVEESTTASRPYKVGEHLVLNWILYRVTVAIAQSGTITPGTNCTQTTVGDEIANKVLRFDNITVNATTGDIATKNDDRITADHELVRHEFGNSLGITSGVNVTTSAGKVVLNGTCKSATTVKLILIKPDN